MLDLGGIFWVDFGEFDKLDEGESLFEGLEEGCVMVDVVPEESG